MSRIRDIISAEYRELFNGVDDVTTSRTRKLQNCKNGLQQFGKLMAQVFLLQIFSCIYCCFQCIIKQLLDSKPEPADNLKKYKKKHIPKRNILKTQNTSQNQDESWISNISVSFQNHHQTNSISNSSSEYVLSCIIGLGLRIISRIIQTSVNVIRRSRSLIQ